MTIKRSPLEIPLNLLFAGFFVFGNYALITHWDERWSDKYSPVLVLDLICLGCWVIIGLVALAISIYHRSKVSKQIIEIE